MWLSEQQSSRVKWHMAAATLAAPIGAHSTGASVCRADGSFCSHREKWTLQAPAQTCAGWVRHQPWSSDSELPYPKPHSCLRCSALCPMVSLLSTHPWLIPLQSHSPSLTMKVFVLGWLSARVPSVGSRWPCNTEQALQIRTRGGSAAQEWLVSWRPPRHLLLARVMTWGLLATSVQALWLTILLSSHFAWCLSLTILFYVARTELGTKNAKGAVKRGVLLIEII